MQGKSGEGPGSTPLGQRWTRLPCRRSNKYCHNGGRAEYGGGLAPWSTKAIMVPSCGPWKSLFAGASVTSKEAPNQKGPVLQRGQPASFGRGPSPICLAVVEYSSSHLAIAKMRRKARVSLRPT